MTACAAREVPLRYCMRNVDERSDNPELPLLSVTLDAGVIRRDELTDDEPIAEDLSHYKHCRIGDLVLNRMRAFQGALGVAPCGGLVSPDYLVLRSEPGVSSHYIAYCLQSAWGVGEMIARIRGIGGIESGVTRTPRINLDDLRSIRIRMHSPKNQQAIADFLDRECARVRFLADELRALVQVLTEHRANFVSKVISDLPGVSLRYRLAGIDQGWSPQCEERIAEEGEWGVLKAGCVNYGRFRPLEHKRLPDDLEPRRQAEVHAGDLLMSRANTRELAGSVAFVASTAGRRLMLSDKLYRLALAPGMRREFVAAVLSSREARDQIEIATSGASSSMQNISQKLVRSLHIPDCDERTQARC